jgi:hypothetical protein
MIWKILTGLIFFLAAGPVFAKAPFCLQNSEGMDCIYLNEAECENLKGPHEFCTVNPKLLTIDQEKSVFLHLDSLEERFCDGAICYQYSQELCSESESRNEVRHLQCLPNH